jgi:tetratricopeptide (TPR) repeat protein
LHFSAGILLASIFAASFVTTGNAETEAGPAFRKGKAAAEQGHWQEALTFLNEAVSRNAHYAEAYKERSIVFSALGRHLESLQDLAHAAELDKAFEPKWPFSTIAPWMYQEGIDNSITQLKHNPSDVEAYRSLARAYSFIAGHIRFKWPQEKADWTSQYEKVIECSTKGLELLNSVNRDTTPKETGDKGNGGRDGNSGGIKDSGSKDDLYARLHFYNLRAAAQHALGRLDEALSDYQTAIPMIRGNSSRELSNLMSLHASRAKIYEEQNQFDKAIADYTTIIEMQTPEGLDKENYYVSRSDLFRRLGKSQKADADLDQALKSYTRRIEKEPYAAWLYELRAGVYAKLSDYEQAVADMTTALTKAPTTARQEKLAQYKAKLAENGH